MTNPLLKTILRCLIGFLLLGFSILAHAPIFALLAMLNFILAGAWLWIEQKS